MIYLLILLLAPLLENCISWAIRKRIVCGGHLKFKRSTLADDIYYDKWYYILAKYLIPHVIWIDSENNKWQYTIKAKAKQELRNKNTFLVFFSLFMYDGEVVALD